MASNFLPVNPILTKNGAFASLVSVFGQAKEPLLKPVPLAAADNVAAGNVGFSVQTMSADLAAKLGFASIFNGSVSFNEIAMTYDAMLYVDKIDPAPSATTIITATRWAIGYRMSIRTTQLKGDASVSFGAVAASASVGTTAANYEINGPGLGKDGFALVAKTLPPLGTFDYDTYYKFTTTLAGQLGAFVATNAGTLVAQPIAVALSSNIDPDPIEEGRAVFFAMKWIATHKTLGQALTDGKFFDPNVLRDVYYRVGAITQDDQKPSNDAVNVASRWLSLT